nr:cytochrome P450 CYP749A22-like [Ipomoea batatas]GMD16572.1 cytochrome P450 CYP749A22-like [Ipomoea batatas]GMD20781.1 cytochrome P450 CYP749A22-like [Ipomoea batatas]
MDLCGKAFGAVSGVSSTAWGYAKQLPSSHINGKAFDAVSGVSSAACGYAKQLSNLATDQQKLGILAVQSSQITDLLNLYGMCTGLGVNATTVGAVATVGVAAWGVYMLAGGPGKKMMMKNPGRPWELIDAVEFRNNPIFRKAIFDRTHLLKAYHNSCLHGHGHYRSPTDVRFSKQIMIALVLLSSRVATVISGGIVITSNKLKGVAAAGGGRGSGRNGPVFVGFLQFLASRNGPVSREGGR